ncbi:MAG: DUF5009 domain-containing protein [Planctomycetaceae bacterium]|nr:DUF5009 domain-containing protein [Planctomycetaceae bacterium]
MERLTKRSVQGRVRSLDAYRGFVMLAMASSGIGIAATMNSEAFQSLDSARLPSYWTSLWENLRYQFSHVAWTGCSFWDLIQPSFMFMVGVSMPFSYGRREESGESQTRMFFHVLWRSAILIALGVFLSSNGRGQTNFTFVNVLTQIGLGYPLLYLLLRPGFNVQLVTVIAITIGYSAAFYMYESPEEDLRNVTEYLTEVKGMDESEWTQFKGSAAHWNKHTNAAAAFDRWFLNLLPSAEEEWRGQRFWVNRGGYQTLNFIPSLITMILGLMAGGILKGDKTNREKLEWLLAAGAVCLVLGVLVDTHIWPQWLRDMTTANWSLCPIVKRIWTPSWAVFSSGWTFWMLAAFFMSIDMTGQHRWSMPLIVVGMNSIAMYCMSQMIKPWAARTLKTHLTTLDIWTGLDPGIIFYLFSSDYAFAPIFEYTSRVFVLWLICVWMYRQKIFIRI